MRWLTSEQERVLRTRSSAAEDLSIALELVERGIITMTWVPCYCGQVPYPHNHPMCNFTERGEIVLIILDVMGRMRWSK